MIHEEALGDEAEAPKHGKDSSICQLVMKNSHGRVAEELVCIVLIGLQEKLCKNNFDSLIVDSVCDTFPLYYITYYFTLQ